MSKQQWSTNLTVRTQISAFLAGAFFAVLLVFVTSQDTQTLLSKVDFHCVLTIVSLTVTFVAFAFSTFAFGLSADDFRKSLEDKAESGTWEQRAKTAFYTGCSFFKMGYFMMMLSLAFVLAYGHWLFALLGILIFIAFWVWLCHKTGFPYREKSKKDE